MNILLLTAHAIAEYDDLRMLTDLGYSVFSIGAYTDPSNPGDDARPALPDVESFPDLIGACERERRTYAKADPGWQEWAVDPAKAHLPDAVIEWADVIIAHHYLDRWILPQWSRIKHKRVVWRTCGQSDPDLEERMSYLRAKGLEVVRYSPREEIAFRRMGSWAGIDALIRFGKYPEDYPAWTGVSGEVRNVTQNYAGRGRLVGFDFWKEATEGLPARYAGDRTEESGGLGRLSYPDLLTFIQEARVFLYTGTVPAPYTLALLEALMVGVPVLSIGPGAWAGPRELLEGHLLAGGFSDMVETARAVLEMATGHQADDVLPMMLRHQELTRTWFDVATVGPQWRRFLGEP